MSRFAGAERILKAPEVWKERCLLGQGSLFTERQLWTRERFEELKKLFVDNPLTDDRPFIEKLEEQLGPGMWVPTALDETFAFFADAWNLERITPPFLRFRIITPAPIPMRVGTLIDHRLRLRGIPVRWRTRITAWDPPRSFTDVQVRGPYRTWVHSHDFVAEHEAPGSTTP